MPSNARKRKHNKRRKKRGIPSNSQENGEKDDLISHDEKEIEISEEERDSSKERMNGLENKQKTGDEGVSVSVVNVEEGTPLSLPDSERKDVSFGFTQSGKGSNGDSSGEHESSDTSSYEESRSIEIVSERNVGSISVAVQIVDHIKRVVSAKEEVKLVAEESPEKISEIERVIETDPVENLEVSQVAEAMVIDLLSSEAVNEKPRESVDPGSAGNEKTQIVAAHSLVRPPWWKCCCGLFELLTGSDK